MLNDDSIDDLDCPMNYDYKTPPSWIISLLLGLQHFLSMCTPNAIATLFLAQHMCLDDNSAVKAQLISVSFFVMGISTLLQTICGCRLPIIQGASFTFLLPFTTMMTMPDIKICNVSNNKFIQDHFTNATQPESVFHLKIRMINGALLISCLVELLISSSGILKYITNLISPLSLASIYMILCMNISENLISMMAEQWAIGIISMVITILLNAVLDPISVPIPTWWIRSGWTWRKVKIFQISPIIVALMFMWMVCGILTASGAFSSDPKGWGYQSRTDIKLKAIYEAPILKIPYILQWGPPIIMPSLIIGTFIGIILSVIESIGDYIITGQVCKAPSVPQFAINRGIFVEGFGVLLSGLLGCTVAPTSYTGNIGILKMTKAGHNKISQIAAIIMILCGIFPIFGAIFVSIPLPIVGGIIFVVTMMIMSCAISNLQNVNLLSTRNGLIFGMSVTLGIYLPQLCDKNKDKFSSGIEQLDDIIQMLLSISLFISFVISVFLDNVLPGHFCRPQEISRMSASFIKANEMTEEEITSVYDHKVLQWMAMKWTFLQYIPLFPAYRHMRSHEDEDKINNPGIHRTEL